MRELIAGGFPAGGVAAQAHFDLLREELAGDLERELAEAVGRGVVFAADVEALAIFRAAVGDLRRVLDALVAFGDVEERAARAGREPEGGEDAAEAGGEEDGPFGHAVIVALAW